MNKTRPTAMRSVTPLLALGLVAAMFGGCNAVKHVLTSAVPTGVRTTDAEPRHFPDAMPRGVDYDIEVVRLNRKQIRFDNRTALAYENVTVWVNEQYGDEIESIPIGRSGAVNLSRFINQHGETFAIGSLLAPEKAAALVTVAIEHKGELHTLPVRLTEDWKRR